MQKLLLIGAGGFLGAISRYLTSGLVHQTFNKTGFPIGTLVVNIAGCLLIGLLNGISENRQIFNPEMRLFLFIGLMGGFTTYSSFGFEVFTLLRDGQTTDALLSASLHMIMGIVAVWLGFALARIIQV